MVALRIERKVVDLIQSVRDTVLFLSVVIRYADIVLLAAI
jgi:hypothetical protein